MKRLIVISFLITAGIATYAQNPFKHGRIIVTSNGHYLQHSNGTPFFWLGDTAWELFHRLTIEETKRLPG